MSRMVELSEEYIFNVVNNKASVLWWLNNYRQERGIVGYKCLYCRKRLLVTTFFCHTTHSKLSPCAYALYKEHKDKLVEWVTE